MMKWASVNDELPKVIGFRPVLVVNDGHVQWAMFNGKTRRFMDDRWYDIHKQVSHWMPIPEPPTEISERPE